MVCACKLVPLLPTSLACIYGRCNGMVRSLEMNACDGRTVTVSAFPPAGNRRGKQT